MNHIDTNKSSVIFCNWYFGHIQIKSSQSDSCYHPLIFCLHLWFHHPSHRCYAVLKDDWLYIYKKPADTCTTDASGMTMYHMSAISHSNQNQINLKWFLLPLILIIYFDICLHLWFHQPTDVMPSSKTTGSTSTRSPPTRAPPMPMTWQATWCRLTWRPSERWETSRIRNCPSL